MELIRKDNKCMKKVRVNTLPGYEDVLDVYILNEYGEVTCTNGRSLSYGDNGHGYKLYGFKVKDKRRWKKGYVHRLVALAFVKNPKPEIYKEVDHIDGNKENNRADNLRWTNRKGNMNNPITINKLAEVKGFECYVYDYLLNYIGHYTSMYDVSTELDITVKYLNSRVKEYYILEKPNLIIIPKINRKQKLQSVVITDIFTHEKFYFPTNRDARRFFDNHVNITNVIQNNSLVHGRYRVRALNYKKLIGTLDL